IWSAGDAPSRHPDFRCPAYVNLPPQCSLQTDPHDHCCKTVHCDYNMVVTTPAPIFAVTTPPTG
ncbi:hypothetical protein MAR_027142, partial [Mya arenaria]